MIRVACPSCGRTFRTMTEGMGKTAVCSGCGQSFRIGSARPKFAWKSNDLGEDSWVGVEAPQEKKELKHCIMCQAPLGEDAIRCMACGANQITGLVHRKRPKPVGNDKEPLWSMLPIRGVLVLAVVVLVGAGVIWGIRGLFTSVAKEGVEMARVRLIQAAAKAVAAGLDDADFTDKYAGKVNDENLPRFVTMLDAGDPMIRKAAGPLIACGSVRQVGPIVAKAASADKAVAEGAIGVLQAIGPRRLVLLSNDADEGIRRTAAQALCWMFRLKVNDATVDDLAEKVDDGEKIERLNTLCRPWPRAVGVFRVMIGDRACPMPATVEQMGRSFYLKIGSGTFVSEFNAERTFSIPIERWCAATGAAVDVRQVRNWVSGTILLTSPFGADWAGEARITARQALSEPPPGFLPVDKLAANQAVTLPVALSVSGASIESQDLAK